MVTSIGNHHGNNLRLRLPSLLLVLLSVITSRSPTAAFPQGAGACPSNGPAVGGIHLLADSVTNGTLVEGDIQVFVDEDRFRTGREYVVWVGEPTEILIRASLSGKGVKGFLVRLGERHDATLAKSSSSSSTASAYDFTNSLSPIPNDENNPYLEADANAVKIEENFCATDNAGGITHTDNSPKYIIKGELLLEEALEDLVLDVTVVVDNAGGTSEFYYSQFWLKSAVQATTSSSSSPDDNDGPNILILGDASSSSSAVAAPSTSTPFSRLTTIIGGVCVAGMLALS